MLNIIKSDFDRYPRVYQNKDNELFLVTKDHCNFLRIISLEKGGHIFSTEYTTLEELLNENSDFKLVEAELTIR